MDTQIAERIYRELGQFVFDHIQDEWAMAWVVAEIEFDDAGTTYGRYKRTMESTSEVLQFDTDDKVFDLFDELRQALKDPQHGHFTQAVFTVSRQGKFTIDFSYDELEGFPWDRSKVVNSMKAQQTAVPPVI